ncbi:lycopene cyclase domain-containing protein [Actinopolymorpha pittospori]|uniref:Lycopene cyclase domain-containing protein n=1 Tax=Actinopolymorpha pittospori TaxID=648752 RepID=A0A927N5B6_9ACTN|nr:lycopene cyclase domain-containing protein [Actinopolymorpha pittospori]
MRSAPIDRFQYLLLMAACLALTLPLEFVFRARVYRRPRRLVRVLVPLLVVFLIWDAIAVGRGHWHFSDRYTTGWLLPFGVPVEELAFFVTIPLCALLTYEAVGTMLTVLRSRRGGRREGQHGPERAPGGEATDA